MPAWGFMRRYVGFHGITCLTIVHIAQQHVSRGMRITQGLRHVEALIASQRFWYPGS